MNRILRLVSWTAKHGLINLYYRILNRKNFEIQVSEEFPVKNSSITDSPLLASYPSLCGIAATDSEVYGKFRSSGILIEALDHVSIEQGKDYIAEILKSTKWKEEYTKVLVDIDKIGEPKKYKFHYGTFSPTLLRYLKVYIDLKKYFGSLGELKLTEIGVGFGGQASLISKLDRPLSYSLYDIPPVLNLAKRFINDVGVSGNFAFIDGRDPAPSEQDLVISNYAFSELSLPVQEQYLNNVILSSSAGYITWNSLSAKQLNGHSLAELIRLIPGSQIVTEEPNTSKDNVIIIWGYNDK
jgi:hypothetical protein